VQVSVIRPGELGPAEVAVWHALQGQTESFGNPFLSPEFAIAVGHLRPGARVAVLSQGPEVVGFFPFERRRLGAGVPIAAGLTDCQGLVHAPGADWEPRMLLRACGMSVWQFDHLVAGQVPFERYQTALAPSPIMNLAQGYEAYQAVLKASSPRLAKEIARKSRKLGREVGELRFVADCPDVGDLRTLMAWKTDQYRRTGRADRFSQPWIVELLEALFATRNDRFSGLLSTLYAGDVPIAIHFGLRFDDVLAGWFPAYDTSFGQYSPGMILVLRMAEAAAAAGVHQIDMGKGAKPYKESLKSHEIFVAEGIVTRPSPLAAVNYARNAPVAWAIREIRRHPPLFSAADALLRQYGQMQRSLRPLPPAAGVIPERAAAEPEPVAKVRS
jgi:CelD/BcsL family acetyltransferase involved in cellulose biosynthesis